MEYAGSTSVAIPGRGARTRSRIAELLDDRPTPRWLAGGGLAVAAGLIASRSPYIVGRGRFWAEEGSVYFAHMHLVGPVRGLGFVHQRAGYSNLAANIPTALAQLVPLRHAPLVTVWFSIAVLLLIVWIALAWPSTLLTKPAARVAAALVLVVGTLATPQVWLTSLHLQAYLGLATVLIAFVAVDELPRRRVVIAVAVLAVAGLSGLYAVALLPVFAFAAWRERSRRRWMLVATLGAAGVLQVAAYLTARASGALVDKRGEVAPDTVYRSVIGHHIDGLVLPERFVLRFMRAPDAGGRPVLIALVALLLVAVLGLSLRAIGRRGSIMLGMAFLLTEAIVLLGSFHGIAAGRYAVVPIGILALVLIGGASAAAPGWVRAVIGSAVAVVLAAGLTQFWTARPTFLRCQGCPSWATEVAAWEQDDRTVLAIWPYDEGAEWMMTLPNPVSEPPPGPPAPSGPPVTAGEPDPAPEPPTTDVDESARGPDAPTPRCTSCAM